jgi:hypothetical protein
MPRFYQRFQPVLKPHEILPPLVLAGYERLPQALRRQTTRPSVPLAPRWRSGFCLTAYQLAPSPRPAGFISLVGPSNRKRIRFDILRDH